MLAAVGQSSTSFRLPNRGKEGLSVLNLTKGETMDIDEMRTVVCELEEYLGLDGSHESTELMECLVGAVSRSDYFISDVLADLVLEELQAHLHIYKTHYLIEEKTITPKPFKRFELRQIYVVD